MKDLPLRDLRNAASAALRRAERGEWMRVTVDRRPVAILGPLPAKRTWLPSEEAMALLAGRQADAALTDELAAVVGSTIQDELANP